MSAIIRQLAILPWRSLHNFVETAPFLQTATCVQRLIRWTVTASSSKSGSRTHQHTTPPPICSCGRMSKVNLTKVCVCLSCVLISSVYTSMTSSLLFPPYKVRHKPSASWTHANDSAQQHQTQ
uniref:Putative secreted protein n=1 Tax=Amblyomma triste TaxID=251400 RepID=A0A023G1W7_AMBTT